MVESKAGWLPPQFSEEARDEGGFPQTDTVVEAVSIVAEAFAGQIDVPVPLVQGLVSEICDRKDNPVPVDTIESYLHNIFPPNSYGVYKLEDQDGATIVDPTTGEDVRGFTFMESLAGEEPYQPTGFNALYANKADGGPVLYGDRKSTRPMRNIPGIRDESVS